jgi:hypothetical protein
LPIKVNGKEINEHPDMISALLSHHSTRSKKLQLREQYVEEAEEKSEISV